MQRMSPFREVLKNRVNNLTLEIESLKQENDRLKAEVARLSDPFLHAPDWAEWFAVDEDGYGYWYSVVPTMDKNTWWSRSMKFDHLSAGYYPELAADWKNTKVKRQRNTEELNGTV